MNAATVSDKAFITARRSHKAGLGSLVTSFASVVTVLLVAMVGLKPIQQKLTELVFTSDRGKTRTKNLCTCTKNFGPY